MAGANKTYIFVIEFVFLKTKVSVIAYYRRMNMAFKRERQIRKLTSFIC